MLDNYRLEFFKISALVSIVLFLVLGVSHLFSVDSKILELGYGNLFYAFILSINYAHFYITKDYEKAIQLFNAILLTLFFPILAFSGIDQTSIYWIVTIIPVFVFVNPTKRGLMLATTFITFIIGYYALSRQGVVPCDYSFAQIGFMVLASSTILICVYYYEKTILTQGQILQDLNNNLEEVVRKQTQKLQELNEQLSKDVQKKEKENSTLKEKAYTDHLTNIYNRAFFSEHVVDNIDNYCFVLFDIDHFKQINDTYGHDRGDAVLQELTKLVLENIKREDILVRWGGEEFLIVISSIDVNSVFTLAKRVNNAVKGHNFSIPQKVTISIGISCSYASDSYEEVLKRADEALYEAKHAGRNAVRVK